jgi:hypothetical protein
MHQRPTDPRLLRLFDPADHEQIEILCTCGQRVLFGPGVMQRTRRVSSDTLIYDLQFWLRCKFCNAWRGFKISIRDTRPLTNKTFVGDPDIVIVDDAS